MTQTHAHPVAGIAPPGCLQVGSRRWFLRTSLAGASVLAAPHFRTAEPHAGKKPAVILFWLSGGLSHIDSWDPKLPFMACLLSLQHRICIENSTKTSHF